MVDNGRIFLNALFVWCFGAFETLGKHWGTWHALLERSNDERYLI